MWDKIGLAWPGWQVSYCRQDQDGWGTQSPWGWDSAEENRG